MIDKIILTPELGQGDLTIDLADILRIATEDKTMKHKGNIEKRLEGMVANDNYRNEPSIQLVAGAGFEPTTFGL